VTIVLPIHCIIQTFAKTAVIMAASRKSWKSISTKKNRKMSNVANVNSFP